LKDGTKDIEDISSQPDDDELERQAIGTASSEVLNNLG
jgi:hypothetical protein